VDALIAAYQAEFDPEKRVALVREIDGIAAHEYHYILQWNMPFRRIAYWNRFGHPMTYLTRTGFTQTGPGADLLSLWWHDAEAARRLESARRDGSSLGTGTVEIDPWR
jgi:ABC-type oligopeptide transport system substrate-binding subunit